MAGRRRTHIRRDSPCHADEALKMLDVLMMLERKNAGRIRIPAQEGHTAHGCESDGEDKARVVIVE